MKNLLTDKTLKAFEEWLMNQNFSTWSLRNGINWSSIVSHTGISAFSSLPNSMQYGVLIDFFDSVGIEIEIERLRSDAFCGNLYGLEMYLSTDYPTRQEAQVAAITKANEIFNQKN